MTLITLHTVLAETKKEIQVSDSGNQTKAGRERKTLEVSYIPLLAFPSQRPLGRQVQSQLPGAFFRPRSLPIFYKTPKLHHRHSFDHAPRSSPKHYGQSEKTGSLKPIHIVSARIQNRQVFGEAENSTFPSDRARARLVARTQPEHKPAPIHRRSRECHASKAVRGRRENGVKSPSGCCTRPITDSFLGQCQQTTLSVLYVR